MLSVIIKLLVTLVVAFPGGTINAVEIGVKNESSRGRVPQPTPQVIGIKLLTELAGGKTERGRFELP